MPSEITKFVQVKTIQPLHWFLGSGFHWFGFPGVHLMKKVNGTITVMIDLAKEKSKGNNINVTLVNIKTNEPVIITPETKQEIDLDQDSVYVLIINLTNVINKPEKYSGNVETWVIKLEPEGT